MPQILSEKLRQFVEENRPEPNAWYLDLVSGLADKAGLDIVEPNDYVIEFPAQGGCFAVVAWGSSYMQREDTFLGWLFGRQKEVRPFRCIFFDGVLHISWEEKVSKDQVTYTPHLSGTGFWFCGYDGRVDIEVALLEAAGIAPVVVSLPEPAIELPWAPWCYDMGPDSWQQTLMSFDSEVPGIMAEFLQAVQKASLVES